MENIVNSTIALVALRKESVDRNSRYSSTRCVSLVALRKESVDRNTNGDETEGFYYRRSPQGERG